MEIKRRKGYDCDISRVLSAGLSTKVLPNTALNPTPQRRRSPPRNTEDCRCYVSVKPSSLLSGRKQHEICKAHLPQLSLTGARIVSTSWHQGVQKMNFSINASLERTKSDICHHPTLAFKAQLTSFRVHDTVSNQQPSSTAGFPLNIRNVLVSELD